jgi:hypothetical protein
MPVRTKNWAMVVCGLSLSIVLSSGCATPKGGVPDKLPELLTKASEEIDNQSAVIFTELESSIAANRGTLKVLELIEPVISSLDTSKLSDTQIKAINKFKKGYPHVTKQAKSVLSRKAEVEVYRQNLSTLTNAILFGVGYLKQDDPNQQIDAMMELINFDTTEK